MCNGFAVTCIRHGLHDNALVPCAHQARGPLQLPQAHTGNGSKRVAGHARGCRSVLGCRGLPTQVRTCMCRPLERKYGAIRTVVAPRSAQRPAGTCMPRMEAPSSFSSASSASSAGVQAAACFLASESSGAMQQGQCWAPMAHDKLRHASAMQIKGQITCTWHPPGAHTQGLGVGRSGNMDGWPDLTTAAFDDALSALYLLHLQLSALLFPCEQLRRSAAP